ncbi:MAG: amidohydrolase family protein, partial [Bacillota bacterium]|nr:amidohydrolase family protein [Bacillota bacterium]
IYPNPIARIATKSICNFYDLKSNLNATSEVLRSLGKEGGISKFVLLPVALKPQQVGEINHFIASEAAAHEEFIGFGTLHAAMDDPLSEIEKLQDLNLKGIKLHPDTQQFPIDDERLYPIYDALQGRYPVLIHCGDPRYDFSHPRRLKKILHMFPDLTVIAAHLGGWSVFDEAMECLENETCYLDISSSIMFLGQAKAKKYIYRYGADRILFGSDFPLWSPVQELETFLSLGFSTEDQEKIASKNAKRLLHLQD